MSYFRGDFKSQTLRMRTHMAVILPEEGAPRGTLILLHGLKGGSDDWVRYTAIERYVQPYGLAVFMPEVQRSWYMDMERGLPYFTYITEELPAFLARTFRVPVDGEHLYIGGLSMGGYGAMKCALTRPERYAGCISLSARFYLENKRALIRDKAQDWSEWQALVGQDVCIGPENDLEHLAQQAAACPRKMPMYMACGTEDPAHDETTRLHAVLVRCGFPAVCEDWPGIHSWDFWDEGIRRGLKSAVGRAESR